MDNHRTLHVIRSCVYSKVHNLPSGGKLDNTGKLILRQHSYKHTKVHVGTYRQVSLVHKKHGVSESKWLCIFVLKFQTPESRISDGDSKVVQGEVCQFL